MRQNKNDCFLTTQGVLSNLRIDRRDYKEIVDHVSFKCREIGKQGPCQDGEILVLNKESDVSCKSERPSHPQNSTLIIQCFAPFCLSNGGCSEDEIFYDGDCWGPEEVIEACEVINFMLLWTG